MQTKPTKCRKFWCAFRADYQGSRYVIALSARQAAEAFALDQPWKLRTDQTVEAKCGKDVATAVVTQNGRAG